MEVKPGYKHTEVGIIPEEWEVPKVESIIKEISMGPFGSDITVSNFVSSGVPVLNGANVAFERLVDSFENFVTPAKARSLKKAVARRGDIVVTHRGTIGQIAYIPEDSEFDRYIVSQSQFRVRFSKDAVIPAWVVLYFHSGNGAKRLLEGKGHTGVPAIAQPTRTFKNLNIPVPPLPEQRAIATALSDVDGLLSGLDRLIAKKRDLKQAAMHQLLTGKTRLPGFAEAKPKYSQSEIGPLPDDWTVVAVNKVTRSHKQGYYTKDKYVDRGVRLVRITDLMNPQIDYPAMPMLNISVGDHDLYKIRIGDFLFARSGAIGRYGIVYDEVDAVFGSYIIRFSFDPAQLTNEYFGFLYETRVVWKQLLSITQGSSNMNINAGNIKSLKIPLPSLPEQTAIAEVLTEMDLELTALEQRREKTRALKQGMMQQLLTGLIRLVKPERAEANAKA